MADPDPPPPATHTHDVTPKVAGSKLMEISKVSFPMESSQATNYIKRIN